VSRSRRSRRRNRRRRSPRHRSRRRSRRLRSRCRRCWKVRGWGRCCGSCAAWEDAVLCALPSVPPR
ncbi:hypothetical protein E1200_21655, partial [Actinomadura sp. GC306]